MTTPAAIITEPPCFLHIFGVCCLPRVLCCLTEHYFLFLNFYPRPSPSLMGSMWFTLCCLPSRGPPPPTLSLQPLLQGWEQPHRTVSHQFCACRLLQTSSAALAHCTACRSPYVSPLQGWATCSAVAGCTLESAILFPLSSPLLCSSSFLVLQPFPFSCPTVSSFHHLTPGVAKLKYFGMINQQ